MSSTAFVQIICKLPNIRIFRLTFPALCLRQDNKSATDQAPRHPPQPLQEAAESLSGKHSKDDGRVVRGKSKPAQGGSGGRFYLNVTGFPFPLGPLFARQTVRCEVTTLVRLEAVVLAKLSHRPYMSKARPDCSLFETTSNSFNLYAGAAFADMSVSSSFSRLPNCRLRMTVLQQLSNQHSFVRSTAMFRWSLALSGALNRSTRWQASMLPPPFA